MILQNLILDSTEELLCIRQKGRIEKQEEELSFEAGADLSTNTYLNSFSIGKWYQYCNIDNVELRIRGNGVFSIKVLHAYCDQDEKLIEEILDDRKQELSSEHDYVFSFEKNLAGVVYYQLHAASAKAGLLGADYIGISDKVNPVKMALNICTYKREEYLLRNLTLLNELFLQKKQTILSERLEVFVTDNGNTLDIDSISSPKIHVVYNPNVGGTGGFTRGLIEIGKVKKEKEITHVIFMDDDIEIIPECLLRTYRFLCVLKEEYQNSFISGAMINLDRRYEQHESGALWNKGRCLFRNRGMDLREFSNVVLNEKVTPIDYAAWWYCCMPASVIGKDNMPIPIFIHEDDVEYSLRNAKGIITLNGIAVRHPVAENRLFFYDSLKVLDDMVFNTFAFGAAREIAYCKKEIYHYRYVAESITNSYKKDRVNQDCRVWNVLLAYEKGMSESAKWDDTRKKAFEEALSCRIIKSFSICCRLNFFHKENPLTQKQRLSYVREVLETDLYQEAFAKVKMKDLEWKLKIMAVFGKMRWTYGIYLLHCGQSLLTGH